jgi:hypothetical protein
MSRTNRPTRRMVGPKPKSSVCHSGWPSSIGWALMTTCFWSSRSIRPSSAKAGRSVLKCVDGEPSVPLGGAVSVLKSPSIVSPVDVTSATLPLPTSARKKL